MNKKQKKILYRIIISAAVAISALVLPIPDIFKNIFCFVSYLIIGYDILRKAGKGILNKQPFDENFLMAIATIGAIILGEYIEGVAVMLFYQTGELFQSYAVGKSRRNISELMNISPEQANIIDEDGNISEVYPDEVSVGSIILIKPGEKIPIDGVIADGFASIDTAALTGESILREVRCGDEVISGCVNMNGVIKVRTTKEFGESTVSKILELVENAGSKKSHSEKFISKFAFVYTPLVCVAALMLAIAVPVARIFAGVSADWNIWIYRALTFLVISCPCALVISVPLTFFAGIGGAGKAGILIKGSNYIETLSKVKYVVFDKTGTLTKGKFEVSDIYAVDGDKDKLLLYASLAEVHSGHPVSRCIREAYGKEADKKRISNINELSGMGVCADIDGVNTAVGNIRLMEYAGVTALEFDKPGTVVHVAIGGDYKGYIVVTDTVKEDSSKAVEILKKLGIKNTLMLTGDRKRTGESVASAIGIDEVYSELLPGDKVRIAEKLINSKKNNEKLAYVGDGINDAPVLTRADVGIAMGALGSDAAIEAADVVLMDDNPLKIPHVIEISKKCMSIVYENIYFAIAIKLVCLVLGAFGITNMWFAIFSDVGVMVIAVLNAIRALNVRKGKKYELRM